MPRLIPIFLILLCCQYSESAFSQNVATADKYYVYDKKWKQIDNVKKAAFLARLHAVNDTCYEFVTYKFTGPRVAKETYKDTDLKTAHGEWYHYKPNGYIDSITNYFNGFAHGTWHFLNDTGRLYLQKEYNMGKLVAVHDVIKEDSIRLAKEGPDKLDSTEVESVFQGSIAAWSRYLSQNLRYPARALEGEIQGMVIVQFIVDEAGTINRPDIFRSVEFSLDEEALRLITQSPKWIAATKAGEPVKSYKRQPIHFRLE